MRRKKWFIIFLVILLLISLTGCSGEKKENEQSNYVVVKISNGSTVDDLFEFESVSKIALNTEFSKVDAENGCYCIGALSGGNSVVWKSDDDGYGYDDCLFLYVDDKVSDVQVATYASKLKQEPISYENFKEKYKQKEK